MRNLDSVTKTMQGCYPAEPNQSCPLKSTLTRTRLPKNSLFTARSLVSLCVLFLLAPLSSFAADEAETTEVTPPRVYQEARALRQEVDHIRRVLGERAPRARSFTLSGALPRQTFYQSQTLFRKCNQLASELAGVSRQRPEPAPDREIVPADVLRMLQAARQQLAYTKEALGIEETAELPKLERRRTPSDVMFEIIEAGYVINQLVSQRAEWADIYDRLVLMINYTAGAIPVEAQYPSLPDHVCCKLPEDVYQHLFGTMEALRPIADSVDFSLVRITPKKRAEGGASIDVVYDLTTTLVSDFAEVTYRLDADDSVDLPSYPRPARILPSHVFQLAQVLRQQVDVIELK